VNVQQRKVLAALAACRTAAMGGHLHRCTACHTQTPLYNSCGNRHCPKCQAGDRAAWLEARRRELLPVEYFHVVFTVPHELSSLAAAHPALFYNLLFRAVRETLLQVAATPRHLGAQIGGLMVLHTWGQTLELHPHVHVIVPGGGLSPDGQRWISCKPGFFLPVRVLSRLLRGKLLAFLKQANDREKLSWTGGLAALADPQQFARFLSPLYQKEWAVYAKPPHNGPEQALKYLARYTYRVAISNERIESLDDGQVTFRYKAYAHGHRLRQMTLTAHEFLRRFMQHVLPRGFVRIRSFGLLAHRGREEQLARCRQLLQVAESECTARSGEEADCSAAEAEVTRCPFCGQGTLQLVARTPRPRLSELVASTYQRKIFDSS
jgi:putative transposase/transposase-like zinc-binding protein